LATAFFPVRAAFARSTLLLAKAASGSPAGNGSRLTDGRSHQSQGLLSIQPRIGSYAMPICSVALICLAAVLRVQTQEPQVIRPGDRALDVARLQPGRWTMEMQVVRDGAGQSVGRSEVELKRVERDGQSALLLTQVMTSPRGTMTDSVLLTRDGLRPISHRSRAPMRVLELDFENLKVTGKTGPADKVESFTRAVAELPFDAGAMDIVFQALPLKADYRARLPMYIHEMGGLVWHNLAVTGETEAVLGGVKVPAWQMKVATDTYSATYTMAKETGAVLGIEAERQGVIVRVARK
jgi:hypothetical protein